MPTRGKTAPGRLRRLDAFLAQTLCEGLSGVPVVNAAAGPPVVIDLGFGHVPVTTVDMARSLWRRCSALEVVGVESDRVRAEKAASSWGAQAPEDLRSLAPTFTSRRGGWTCRVAGSMTFRYGGFLVPLEEAERPRVSVVRAMNVLRQYESLAECKKAHRTMLAQLAHDGGLLLEGSSDPTGRVIITYVIRRGEPVAPEALLFQLDLREQARRGGLTLDIVTGNLPQLLILRRCSTFEDFLSRWRSAIETTAAQQRGGVREHFLLAGRQLALNLPACQGEVVVRKRWLRRGWLLWRRPPYPGAKGEAT